jgi:hypothetical protein
MELKPGIYRDIPSDQYHAWPAKNFSSIKTARRSLLHYHYEQTHPTEQTAAMALGQAFHHATLEIDTWMSDYAKAPKVDRRTKDGKEQWAAFQLASLRKTVLSAEDHDLVEEMQGAVHTHTLAAAMLKEPGMTEVSVVWEDDATGLLCKARIDRLTKWDGWTHAIDLKSCQDASPDGFAKACGNYDYHMQAAWYLEGLAAHDPRERKFSFIAVEKSPPHAVAVYELEEWALQQGRDECRSVLASIAEAEQSGMWGGYGNEITTLALPRWRQRTEDIL